MLREAIILAGGLGTRLRDTVSDLPKVLAPVNNQPFLYYLLANLFKQNLNHVVLSTGYMGEKIEEFIKNRYPEKNISIAKEEKPLGTGGGIFNALQFCNSDEILILNGDTFFNIDYNFFYHHHNHHGSEFSIALKPMKTVDRYGTVECNGHHRIKAFKEKTVMDEGLINGGIYIVNKPIFQSISWPEQFSMEKDYMEAYCTTHAMFGFPYDEYFIDIGIPEDYNKAMDDFKQLFK